MKKNLLIFLAFMIYLIVFGYINQYQIIDEIKSLMYKTSYFKAAVYFLGFMASVFSIQIMLNLKSKLFSIFFILILFITTSITLTYAMVDSQGIGYEDALNILQLLTSPVALESGNTYMNFFIKSSMYSLGLIIILMVTNYYFIPIKINNRWILIPLLSFIFVYVLIYKTTANRLSFSPPYKIINLLLYAQFNTLFSGERDSISFRKPNDGIIKNIVLIVDESIRSDKLQINGCEKETTPYLMSIKKKIFNYGMCVSGAVCSNYSEAILLTGIGYEKLPDTTSFSRKKPSLFSYAKYANYETSLIDLMINKTNNRHFLMEDDFKYIDNQVDLSKYYPEEKAYNLDFKAIDLLKQTLKNNKKSFAYFVKYGSHFHYEHAYPETKKVFTPTQDSAKWNTEDKEKFLNSYCNSIRWTVDSFFEQLVKELEGTNTLVIYTSDHGQNLMDDLTINQTHCAKGFAPKEMAMVPLLLLPMNKDVASVINKIYQKRNLDHTSHFNVFGSILYLMGYDKKNIHIKYGKTIFDDLEKQNKIYTSGDIFGRSQMFKNMFKEED